MKDKIMIICFALLVMLISVAGYSQIINRPIIFENVGLALYDGLPYYQYNTGYTMINDDQLAYFRAYKCSRKAVIVLKAEKSMPIFAVVYLQGPNPEGIVNGWVDDDCDGKFRKMNVEDKSEIPKCYIKKGDNDE